MSHTLDDDLRHACARIAPTWPLDQFIAVNPYWGWREQRSDAAAARLGALAGTRLTMRREDILAAWMRGTLREEHLMSALARTCDTLTTDELRDAMHRPTDVPQRLPLVSDLRGDAEPRLVPRWPDLVTHQISQHCAAFFDEGQARWHLDRSGGLYASWRRQLAHDRGLPWQAGGADARRRIAALPDSARALVEQALAALGIAPEARRDYLSALLLAINGWAAWCAWLRWQAALEGGSDDHLEQLLAIRLAWEWLLAEDAPERLDLPRWRAEWRQAEARVAALAGAQRTDWLLQLALEIAYQEPLAQRLAAAPRAAEPAPTTVQAVFCIDVRSEPYRRALEAADTTVRTRGFAGFFGLPIDYRPLGSALVRPQLPGLLASAHTVGETGDDRSASLGEHLAQRRRAALDWRQRWAELRAAAASGFSFVESCGLAYGARLVADSLPSTTPPARWEDTGLGRDAARLRPHLALVDEDADAAASVAHGILQAMGLTRGFAPLVMLCGHGSTSANNAHAAGLDCGACGGQTGEVNARVLAGLLNHGAVREALALRGVVIPRETHFLAALHDTTTDDVRLFDADRVPAALRDTLAGLRRALAQAGARTRAERAASLGLGALAGRDDALAAALRRRANDWSQTRPEWGLANNAAFVIAPRRRTQGLNLAGRCFLHDYDWRDDHDGHVLELLMSAPMVVANWINLQYHASTLDNRRYGSGNKLLHNVVGRRIGVFEGNGGDLRIGLPLQSLADAGGWRHEALRLSVYVEATRTMIEQVIAKHAVVRALVEHGWLHLLRIDPISSSVELRQGRQWLTLVPAARPPAGRAPSGLEQVEALGLHLHEGARERSHLSPGA